MAYGYLETIHVEHSMKTEDGDWIAILAVDAIDGNFADVYGEFEDEAVALAGEVVRAFKQRDALADVCRMLLEYLGPRPEGERLRWEHYRARAALIDKIMEALDES